MVLLLSESPLVREQQMMMQNAQSGRGEDKKRDFVSLTLFVSVCCCDCGLRRVFCGGACLARLFLMSLVLLEKWPGL